MHSIGRRFAERDHGLGKRQSAFGRGVDDDGDSCVTDGHRHHREDYQKQHLVQGVDPIELNSRVTKKPVGKSSPTPVHAVAGEGDVRLVVNAYRRRNGEYRRQQPDEQDHLLRPAYRRQPHIPHRIRDGDIPLERDHRHCQHRAEAGELLDVVHRVAGESSHEPRVRHVLDEHDWNTKPDQTEIRSAQGGQENIRHVSHPFEAIHHEDHHGVSNCSDEEHDEIHQRRKSSLEQLLLGEAE